MRIIQACAVPFQIVQLTLHRLRRRRVDRRPRLDVDPNPKRWIPGPGVSSGGEVGVRNPKLARGYANED
mgnify:CR=1 FL=1